MAYDFNPLKTGIEESKEWLSRELSGVRTGRATPALLDGVKPEIYGVRTPMSQIGSITIEDPKTLRVSLWDASQVKIVEKAIVEANLGISVASDSSGLRVIFPELTSERRTMLQKIVGEKLEQAKVTLRGHRTDALKRLDQASAEGGMGEDEIKRLKGDIQKMIDTAGAELEALAEKKKTELES